MNYFEYVLADLPEKVEPINLQNSRSSKQFHAFSHPSSVDFPYLLHCIMAEAPLTTIVTQVRGADGIGPL